MVILLLSMTALACDTVQPRADGALVVQLFVGPDRPPPALRLTRTAPFGAPDPGVRSADVSLWVAGRRVRYRPADSVGTWVPDTPTDTVRAGAYFRLEVVSGADRLEAEGIVPPAVGPVSVDVSVPDHAVEAVLLDSLSLPLDSLRFELPSRTGFLYPVVARVRWNPPPASSIPEWWMETRLVPVRRFSSTLIDYFLRPEGVLRETSGEDGPLEWSGVYAVPVAAADDALPPHELRVVLLRGSGDWAAFASSDGDPDRREPVSNVRGGIGIAAGLAVDTLRIVIR